MNIFCLDICPEKAAVFHCDKHVVKMITESAQLLSTCYYVVDHEEYLRLSDVLMRPTHINHPCSKWLRLSKENYEWTRQLLISLIKEYDYRYGKVQNFKKAREIAKILPPSKLPSLGLTEHALAMPDECKIPGYPVESYRNYYRMHKRHIAVWTNRDIPYWWF